MSTNVQATRRRLDFLDAHRGLAVLLMLWMHSADGWLRPELKQGPTWDLIRALGGFAAPSFLLLSGVSLAFGWAYSAADQRGRVLRAGVARGLQLVVLGYGLRLQMWMLDGAGYRSPEGWAAAVPIAFAYGAAYFALDAWSRGRRARMLSVAALVAGTAGFGVLSAALPERLASLTRIDVLQAIGASVVALALLRRPLERTPELGFGLGLLVALLTPSLQALVPGPLPAGLAGYLAKWPAPPGQLNATLFPLFPWLAYPLIGATLGVRLAGAERHGRGAERFAWRMAVAAIAIALLSCEALPIARAAIASHPWLTPAMRVTYRAAIALVLGGAALLVSGGRAPLLGSSLIALGRASLIVYWVHLQFAFGAAVKPIARRLDVAQWAQGLAIFAVASIVFAIGWLRLRAWFRGRARSAKGAGALAPDPAALPNT